MSIKSLDQLKIERSVIKSKVTRFATFWNSLDKRTGNVGVLKVQLERLELQYDAFDVVQTHIELDPKNEDAVSQEREEKERTEFESRYCELVAAATEHIEINTRRATNEHSMEQISSSSHRLRSPFTSSGDPSYQLPRMPLPSFNGSLENWIKFRDSFKAIVHDRDIPNIDKFHYLNQALTGDAARVIQSLGISDVNYDIAWKSLTDRYEDLNALIHNHVRALCKLKTIAKESFTELRQFIDDMNNNLRALKALNQPTDVWDTLLLFLMSEKLDPNTRREWEKKQAKCRELPKFKDFLSFLEDQSKFLHRAQIEKQGLPTNSHVKSNAPNNKKRSGNLTSHVATEKSACAMCAKPHAIYECNEFKKLSVPERVNAVRKLHLCFNCIYSGHGNRNCQSGSCRKCAKRHHTLLHTEWTSQPKKLDQEQESSRENLICHTSHIVGSSRKVDHDEDPYVVLSTAIVHIRDRKGNFHECRVLLDTGSQPNLITEDLCCRLELPVSAIDMTISGVSPKDLENVQIPPHIQLADPTIKNPQVDLLIGAGLFWELLCVGQIRLLREGLVPQKTVLGWVLAGNLLASTNMRKFNTSCHHVITNQQVNNQVEKFWELDQISSSKGAKDLDTENVCEQHCIATTKRATDGRFIVNIPYCDRVMDLGNSFEIAKQRLIAMERKLEKDAQLKNGYLEFMKEYEASGDITEVASDQIDSDPPMYYLPHHAVMKPDSTTTKIRVVFDGSSKTSSGISLNEVQHVGPTVQDDLFSIVLRFRKHKIVLSVDVAKMYRRIYVDEGQRKTQRILWRPDSAQPIKVYELNTVTYGTAAAPYLATRCLRQLGENNKEQHPNASIAIISDFYVDDLLTGADSLDEARILKDELSSILEPAGLSLRKWASNDERVFATEDSLDGIRAIQGDKDPKTLGLLWNIQSDQLTKEGVWNHVSSPDNPADIISRGIDPAELKDSELWWHGPAWLSQDSNHWPNPPDLDLENAPGKRKCTSNQVTVERKEPSIFERFSSFTVLIRVLSYVYRVRDNLSRPTTDYKIGFLKPREILCTRNRVIRLAQAESFKDEISCLKRKREIAKSSNIKLLNPFLDDSGLLRVGGRLNHALIPYDQRHPIILPSNHLVIRLIIKDEHIRLMHAGCQGVIASLRTRFWHHEEFISGTCNTFSSLYQLWS